MMWPLLHWSVSVGMGRWPMGHKKRSGEEPSVVRRSCLMSVSCFLLLCFVTTFGIAPTLALLGTFWSGLLVWVLGPTPSTPHPRLFLASLIPPPSSPPLLSAATSVHLELHPQLLVGVLHVLPQRHLLGRAESAVWLVLDEAACCGDRGGQSENSLQTRLLLSPSWCPSYLS